MAEHVQLGQEPLTGSQISYKDVPFYLSGNESASAGLIVIQEWWGVSPHIKRMTQRFADQVGVLAISPDVI